MTYSAEYNDGYVKLYVDSVGMRIELPLSYIGFTVYDPEFLTALRDDLTAWLGETECDLVHDAPSCESPNCWRLRIPPCDGDHAMPKCGNANCWHGDGTAEGDSATGKEDL